MECKRCRFRRLLIFICIIFFTYSCNQKKESQGLNNEKVIYSVKDSLNIASNIVKIRTLESDENLKNHMIDLFIKELDSIGDNSPQKKSISRLVNKSLVKDKEIYELGNKIRNDTVEVNISEMVLNEKGNYASLYFAIFTDLRSEGYIIFFKKNSNQEWDLYFYRRLFR